MKEHFYIDEMGEACCKRVYKNKAEKNRIEKEEKKYRESRAKEYWDSLTEPQKEIIKWCRTDEKAISECLPMAAVRERALDEFYRKENNTHISPVKLIKYNFVYEHFEKFKQFIYDKTKG